jgi:hypothetical protein
MFLSISTFLISSFASLSVCQTANVNFGRNINQNVYYLVNSVQTNSLQATNGLLYTGRGDGLINCYNLTTFDLIQTFEGSQLVVLAYQCRTQGILYDYCNRRRILVLGWL